LNKNLKQLARKSALSIQAKDNNLMVVEDFNFDIVKTKNFTNVLKALELESKKSLFVMSGSNNNVYLSSRNLKTSKVVSNSGLNTYSILNAGKVVISESSLEEINNLSK
jgi:large subunit ribosomal protein L4